MKEIQYADICKREEKERVQGTEEGKGKEGPNRVERRYRLEEDENTIYEYDLRCIKAKGDNV